jgi:hypothetical protein
LTGQWPISNKILMLKGKRSYRELSEDIERKTGRRLPITTLQQLATEPRKGTRKDTLEILAQYAGKPIEWFFAQDLAPDEDLKYNEYLNVLLESGRKLSPEGLRALALMARQYVKAEKEDKEG